MSWTGFQGDRVECPVLRACDVGLEPKLSAFQSPGWPLDSLDAHSALLVSDDLQGFVLDAVVSGERGTQDSNLESPVLETGVRLTRDR